jgi:O-methyltransferase involved in polyketide biosynthesis
METKRGLYEEVAPHLMGKLTSIEADVTEVDLADRIDAYCGRRLNAPTILIIEGLSYYISPDELVGLASSFATGRGLVRVIVEYLLPAEEISEATRSIPAQVFETIRGRSGLASIQRYGTRDMMRLLASAGGYADAHYRMTEMERLRTGDTARFPHPQDGWIACSTGLC